TVLVRCPLAPLIAVTPFWKIFQALANLLCPSSEVGSSGPCIGGAPGRPFGGGGGTLPLGSQGGLGGLPGPLPPPLRPPDAGPSPPIVSKEYGPIELRSLASSACFWAMYAR